MKRRVFQTFTIVLFFVTLWTAYANVFTDDTAVRAQARVVANTAAGCGDACKLTDMRGDRGMISEEIAYDIAGHGHFVVVCRRAYIIAGDYACKVTEQAKVSSAK